jgi:SAM-dependent methyltransferase
MTPTPTDPRSIVTLENAPRRQCARHRARAGRDLRRLALSWLLTGHWHYLPLLLADTGYLLAREKYSAFAIDRIYADTPGGWGWLGRCLDRYVLDLPVHRAVRDRFRFVTRHLVEALHRLLAGRDEVAVLSVPCGLARDLCTAHGQVKRRHPDADRRLKLYGLDLDYEGRVLEEARRRARAAGAPIRLVRGDALDAATWSWLRGEAPALSAILCIGFSPWLAPDELGALLRQFARHLHPGGYLFLDRFNEGRYSKMGSRADILAHYHSDTWVRDCLRTAGLALQTGYPLGGDEGMLYVARKIG